MSRLLRAEVRKTAANATVWWLLLVTAALGAISSYLIVALDDAEGAALLTDHSLQEALHGATVGSILAVVAGIIGMAGDWRFGQVDQLFLVTPRRRSVVKVKAVVYAGVGLLYGLAASAATTAAVWGAYRAEGLALPFDRSAVWLTLLGGVTAAGLLGLLGVALGAIVRNQTIAIVVALTWFFLVESVVYGASLSVARWLPGMAATALARFPDDGYLSPGTAAVVLSAAVAAGLLLGTRLVTRDDVTG